MVDARYRALADVAGVLASHVELSDLLHDLSGLLEPLVHFEFLGVYLKDADGQTISLRHKETRSPVTLAPPMPFSLTDSLPGRALSTNRAVYVDQVVADGPAPSSRLVDPRHPAATARRPLVTPRQALGALAFGAYEAAAYTSDDVEFMGRVAALVAVAVENAQSLETVREQQAALQRERDQLDLLLDVTNAVVTQLDTRALFRAVAPALRGACSADAGGADALRPRGARAAQARVRPAGARRRRSAGGASSCRSTARRPAWSSGPASRASSACPS